MFGNEEILLRDGIYPVMLGAGREVLRRVRGWVCSTLDVTGPTTQWWHRGPLVGLQKEKAEAL